MTRTKTIKKTAGHLKGNLWVWNNGSMTNMGFIAEAIAKNKPIPVGFIDACMKSNSNNAKILAQHARDMKIKETVMVP